jgi:hypothetical protein
MKPVRDVRIVAVLFLISGVTAVVRMIQTRTLQLAPGLIAIPTAIGLLRWSNGWRLVALATLWIALAVSILAGAYWLFHGDLSGEISISIPSYLGKSTAMIVTVVVVGVALTLWQLRVLTRPAVRRSFELGDPAA